MIAKRGSWAVDTMRSDKFKSGNFSGLHWLLDPLDVNYPSQFVPRSSTNLSGQKKFTVNRPSLNHSDAESSTHSEQ
jgi:hypothetical protein